MALDRKSLADQAIAHLNRLLNYARTELRAREALGDLPPGAVRPEDVVDAALLEALEQAARAPEDGLYPWLRRLVRRAIARAVADWRRRRRERSLFEPVGSGRPDEEGAGPPRRLVDVLPDPNAPIPEQVVASEEFQRALAALLYQMPASWRDPFLLYAYDNLPLAQVARLEGLPVAEVRRRIERARDFLRARLAEEYEDADVPAPSEALFAALERLDPLPELAARLRERLQAAAA